MCGQAFTENERLRAGVGVTPLRGVACSPSKASHIFQAWLFHRDRARCSDFFLGAAPTSDCGKGFRCFERLEHSVRIGCLFRDDLEHVPVLDDLSIAFQSEDVDARPSVITGPILPTMKNDVVSLGYDSFELDMFAGVIARHALEVVYERLLSV